MENVLLFFATLLLLCTTAIAQGEAVGGQGTELIFIGIAVLVVIMIAVVLFLMLKKKQNVYTYGYGIK